MKKQIPNFLTLLNLASGFISITLVLQGYDYLVWASMFVFIATIFDYLDGTAARLLKAYSEIGKQLDSLADVVSFGVAPGLILYELLAIHCANGCNVLERWHVIPYFALLIPVCSALRLAKFNIDPRQAENFIGLPTPANAIFFSSIPLILSAKSGLYTLVQLDFLVAFFSNPRVLAVLSVFFSYLLVSEFRLFSMKFKSLELKGNEHRFVFLILSVALLVVFSVNAIPLVILTYLLLSLVFQKRIL
jgi:CDP-diacylglycerol---serine O-phosphatidyltransferase